MDQAGTKSDILGKSGYPNSFPFTSLVSLEGLKQLHIDHNPAWIYNMQFKSNLGDLNTPFQHGYNNSNKILELQQNEVIIGVYGDSFDNRYHEFKRFGFIIGTLA